MMTTTVFNLCSFKFYLQLGKSLRSDIVEELINGKIYCLACKNLFNLASSNINSKYLFHDITDVFDHLER